MTWSEKNDSWINWWASPRLTLGFGTAICFALCASLPVAHSISLALWLLAELIWWYIHRKIFLPKLLSFRPEDAAELISDRDFDRAIDNMVFLLKNDAEKFWHRVTGKSVPKVPVETARSYVRSLLFINDDEGEDGDDSTDDDDNIQHVGRVSNEGANNEEIGKIKANPSSSRRLLKRGLSRIEEACGGFAPSTSSSTLSPEELLDHVDPTPPHTQHSHTVEEIPNLIQGWGDNKYLSSIVRTTPLVVSAASLLSGLLLKLVLRLFGWKRGVKHPLSKVEYWVYTPSLKSSLLRHSNKEDDEDLDNPLVLIPGAGNGLMSFLPLVLHFQFKAKKRRMVLYRLPHVEVGRPWARLPQWSELVAGVVNGLEHELGITKCDIIAHSYGTAVANRLLRELCLDRLHESKLKIQTLSLLDPIVFGGASAGLVGVINAQGPDLSFAFCANRAGVTPKEILDFDPTEYGQCLGSARRKSLMGHNICVYLSKDDILVDIPLARQILNTYLKSAHLEIDNTSNSFHGRWLVELWTGGAFLNYPCSSRVLRLLYATLGEPRREKNRGEING